jgi:hypothetical protein
VRLYTVSSHIILMYVLINQLTVTTFSHSLLFSGLERGSTTDKDKDTDKRQQGLRWHEEGELDCNNRGMKTERNNEGNRRERDAARLIATMTIHYTTTRIGIGYNDNAKIL